MARDHRQRRAHPRWLEIIGSAERTLDFEEFYLSTWPGEPTEDVLAALGQAVKRGVRVRLILDARMHRTYPRTADSLARIPGFAVRLVDFGRIAGGVQHAKFFIADGATVFLGSQNFDWRSLKHIHELGVRVREPRVAGEFARVFELDWDAATPVGQAADTTRAFRAAPWTHAPGTLPYRIVQAPGDTVLLWPGWSPRHFLPDTTLWDRDLIVRMLDDARREVVAQVLTYSTADRQGRDDALDAALRRAAARGVKVRLVVSDWETGSAALKDLQALARVPGIEVKRSTVPEWSGGYIPFARVESPAISWARATSQSRCATGRWPGRHAPSSSARGSRPGRRRSIPTEPTRARSTASRRPRGRRSTAGRRPGASGVDAPRYLVRPSRIPFRSMIVFWSETITWILSESLSTYR